MSSKGVAYLATAAIDFGTAFSGYAFSFSAKPDDVKQNANWGNEYGFASSKTPTCILLNQDKEFKAFGYDAHAMYMSYDPDDEENTEKLYMYQEFKMCLYKSGNLTETTEIKSVCGQQSCKAMDIFMHALVYLKDHMLTMLGQTIVNVLARSEIQWVLTVPAIWSDGAKQFMRKSACKAGIIPDENSKQLLIALEPEAASLFCRDMCKEDVKKDMLQNVPDNEWTKEKKEGELAKARVTIKPDTKYMVVDSGGGTVDVTAHHYKKNGTLFELYTASGGNWGGMHVNRRFEAILTNLVGAEVLTSLKENDPVGYMNMKIKFETKKRSVDFSKDSYSLHITMPFSMNGFCKKETGKTFQKLVNESQIKDLKFGNGVLKFPQELVDEMFKPVVRFITNHIEMLLGEEELKDIKYIFLVGGFSDCSCLQVEMKKRFQNEKRKIVLSSYDASLSIVKGAVKFGYNPKAISSRRVRYTYGTDIHEPFNPKKHRTEKLVTINGRKFARDVFHPFVIKNEEVTPEDVRCHSFQALQARQNVLSVKMFISDKGEVIYTTDKHDVDLHPANIRIELSDKDGRANRQIKVYLYFGSTEIHVEALDESSPGNKSQKASVNFLQGLSAL